MIKLSSNNKNNTSSSSSFLEYSLLDSGKTSVETCLYKLRFTIRSRISLDSFNNGSVEYNICKNISSFNFSYLSKASSPLKIVENLKYLKS